jgi:sec-independent protein translocase protein TatA
MLFRNFGVGELVLILVLAVLVFGPGRISRLGSEIGRAIRGYKDEVKPRNEGAGTSRDERA